MLGAAELVAFVTVADAEQAARFYGDVLGLTLRERSEFALEFAAANARLRVAISPAAHAARYTVLGWRVDDLDATARQLIARGVEPLRYDTLEQDELGVWESPSGARVLWFADPDGNVLSLTG
jgi:catechol 2,3-dioxygenase-like lactoylglutathione lyase family enzyme